MSVQAVILPLSWTPLRIGDPLEDELALRTLDSELRSWDETPYGIGQQSKGQGVDCVRFVAAVLDFLGGTETPLPSLPQDAAMHDRAGAIAGMLTIKRAFDPLDEVLDGLVQPGDLLVVGPRRGGPGHGMIVGCRPGEVWEAGTRRVQKVGWSLPDTSELFAVYRKKDRKPWARR